MGGSQASNDDEVGNLSILDIRPEYRSDSNNLLQDFYVPCFLNSCSYSRAVGFFTSRGLSVAAQGLVEFIKKGGNMRLVASPLFEPDDIEAIRRGYRARDQVVKQALLRQIETAQNNLVKNRLGYLAWLITEEHLDIRIAIPVDGENVPTRGIYHEKLGIFKDRFGNIVSFTGSPNETAGGLVENFETIDVFWSWDDPHGRAIRKLQNFERLWDNLTPGLSIHEFPEAVREQLLKFRPVGKPVRDNEPTLSQALWDHQKEAIEAWEKCDRHGLLCMATGSGKTTTALAAAERCPNLALLVISVPKAALVDQWAKEVLEYPKFQQPILVYDSATNWQERLFRRLRGIRQADKLNPVIVIGTMHSISNDRFNSVMIDAHVKGNMLLIVDEVHNVGARSFRKVLREEYVWRLGLSATPVRHFDEEGTGVINSYFGGTIYVYDMRKALGDGKLCPYKYYVYPANLTEAEHEEYQNLTQLITKLRHDYASEDVSYQSHNSFDGDSDEVKSLLFRRARILKKCEAKAKALTEALEEHPIKRGLIYCADEDQLVRMAAVLREMGIQHLTYTSKTPKDTRCETLEALDRGHISALLAIDCLDEGVDIPTVDHAIILASSTNKRQFIQRRGRILRQALGKNLATLVDIIALPPRTMGSEAKKILKGELARAKEMAELSYNKHQALNHIKEITEQYGVLMIELMTGEGDA